MTQKPRFETPDLSQANIEKIASLFPSCITEAVDEEKSTPENKVYKKAVNFEALKTLLGDDNLSRSEAYEFTWVGKKASVIEANKPIRKTLRPCKEESRDWDTTQNLYIEGDNLEVLKLLQESYLGKVKMIYIDPPYNTGNDFVYRDKFVMDSDTWAVDSGQIDEETENKLFRNTESNGRFHSDWCSMIYPRLLLARNLLRDDGVIFISIDDNEVAQLRKICDEVFGESNFVASFIVIRSEGGGLAKHAVIGHDYLLCYANNMKQFIPLGKPKDIRGQIIMKNGEEYWIETDWLRKEFGKYGTCPYEEIEKWLGGSKKNEIDSGLKTGIYTLIPKENYHIVGRYRKTSDDVSKFYTILKHLNKHGVYDLETFGLSEYFSFPKSVNLLKEIILGATIRSKNKDDIILDFFSGSATTAHAVMQLNAEDGGNRKFIMVQLPEPCAPDSEAAKAGYKNICEIGKERIRRAGEKVRAEAGLNGQNLDIGFRVFKAADSNMKDVYYGAGEYKQEELDLFVSNIKEDRTPLDLLYGCLLELALPLSLPHTEENIDGFTVHIVRTDAAENAALIACFDEDISEKVLSDIAKKKPLRAVFRDSGFASDQSKINVLEIFKCRAPDTQVKVI